jgi:hypothetical protein
MSRPINGFQERFQDDRQALPPTGQATLAWSTGSRTTDRDCDAPSLTVLRPSGARPLLCSSRVCFKIRTSSGKSARLAFENQDPNVTELPHFLLRIAEERCPLRQPDVVCQ